MEGITAIPLNKGMVALVDRADALGILRFRWFAHHQNGRWYARRSVRDFEEVRTLRMHHEIIRPDRGRVVDHVNGNGLDNRRENLRVATFSENGANRRPNPGKEVKGVKFERFTGKWSARIGIGGRQVWLGTFETCREAAEAYDGAAVTFFGNYARTNYRWDFAQEG